MEMVGFFVLFCVLEALTKESVVEYFVDVCVYTVITWHVCGGAPVLHRM